MKKYLRIALPVACIILLINIIIFIIPTFGVIYDYLHFKSKLNNEYINNNYANWKTVTIDQAFTFHIPGEWTVINQEGYWEFKSTQDELLGYCISFMPQSTKYKNTASFISKIVGEDVEFTDHEYFQNATNIRASVLVKANYSSEYNSYEFYYFQLFNRDSKSCVLVFPISKMISYDEISQICEAIMYSYYYPEDI